MGNCSSSNEIFTAKMSHIPFEVDINGNSSRELKFEYYDDLKLLRVHDDYFLYMKNLRTKKKGLVLSNMVGKKDTFEMEIWFFGRISQKRSVEFLNHPMNIQGSFLVRNAENDEMDYTLVVKNYNYDMERYDTLKYKINFNNGKFFISTTKKFDNLPSLINACCGGVHRGLACQLTNPCHIVRDSTIGLAAKSRWELPRSEIKFGKLKGSGHFGTVHVGLWRTTAEVAIKSLKSDQKMAQDITEFLNEIRALQSINHPNLIQIYGVCTDSHPYLIITEFITNGDLLSLLRSDEDQSLFGFDDLLRIATDITHGMCAVSKKGIVHRDLAARNILIDKWYRAKIGDFGMSCDKDYVGVGGTGGSLLPIKWTAPESVRKRIFTMKSDIWSFGIVLWEIFTYGETPYPSVEPSKVIKRLNLGYRLEMPEIPILASIDEDEDKRYKEGIYKIMLSCWCKLPDDRPTFQKLRKMLESFKDTLNEELNYDYVSYMKEKGFRNRRQKKGTN